MAMHRRALIRVFPAVALIGLFASRAGATEAAHLVVAENTPAAEPEPSPEERMRRRYPQPVRVGFLIGLPILDWNDSTLGFVTDVVRTPDGKVQLIMPYGGWFGRGGRPVAVPIETVAILARQIDLLDLGRDDLAKLPTFDGRGTTPIGRDETIRIAITRR
jgi:PRC-barrel domain